MHAAPDVWTIATATRRDNYAGFAICLDIAARPPCWTCAKASRIFRSWESRSGQHCPLIVEIGTGQGRKRRQQPHQPPETNFLPRGRPIGPTRCCSPAERGRPTFAWRVNAPELFRWYVTGTVTGRFFPDPGPRKKASKRHIVQAI